MVFKHMKLYIVQHIHEHKTMTCTPTPGITQKRVNPYFHCGPYTGTYANFTVKNSFYVLFMQIFVIENIFALYRKYIES